ncbi:hypothetical protein ABLB69_04765 [Xenorhabdus khoisanae]|uniref:hypothetical protein n=1 Tax=Xenorhabdus khoisanae TaxID=880157 RepID=UPI0032B7F684
MNPDKNRELELQRIYWNKYREEVRKRWNKKAVDRMADKGTRWHFFGARNLHDYMQDNIEELRHEIQINPLSNEEKQFTDAFMKKDFFIVHASSADLTNNVDNNLLIYSRLRLGGKDIVFPTYHSSVEDRGGLGNDDYIFFSLEVGNSLQKPYSRFGTNFYRVAYKKENIALRHSSMTLIDQIGNESPNSRMINNISLAAHSYLDGRQFIRHRVFFSGIDNCLLGLLYSIILETRKFGERLKEDAKQILSARTDDEINRVINGLFRPEVRVPRMFGATKGDYQVIMHKNTL